MRKFITKIHDFLYKYYINHLITTLDLFYNINTIENSNAYCVYISTTSLCEPKRKYARAHFYRHNPIADYFAYRAILHPYFMYAILLTFFMFIILSLFGLNISHSHILVQLTFILYLGISLLLSYSSYEYYFMELYKYSKNKRSTNRPIEFYIISTNNGISIYTDISKIPQEYITEKSIPITLHDVKVALIDYMTLSKKKAKKKWYM